MLFQTVAEGHFTNQRLIFINNTINRLDPQVRLLDPNPVNFLPLTQQISRLDQEVQSQIRNVGYASTNGLELRDRAKNTSAEMELLERHVAEEIDRANKIVEEVRSLALNIEQGTGPKVDNALKEAQAIIKKIQEPLFTEYRDKATDQLDNAHILLSRMERYNVPVSNLDSVVVSLNNKVANFTTKIDDLLNITTNAQSIASAAEKLNFENKIAQETGNFDTVKNSTNEAQDDLLAGEELNKNATRLLNEAIEFFKIIGKYRCQISSWMVNYSRSR